MTRVAPSARDQERAPGRPSGQPIAPRVVGTAGHIDHGKTSLVRALTGIDTDRLKEEKARGITIELGFAHLDLADCGIPDPVGVVDVPGHERFIRTMVAGAVGVDVVVLVVAADEGVMPQTREHLDVCRLLEVKRGVVALTKADLVAPDLVELATEEARGALEGTFLADAEIVPVSSVTGAGLGALRVAIARAIEAAPARDPDGLLRLPLDRVFTMKGFGTVVTGTLWAGRLRAGDEVEALPGGASGKVRAVQVHGRDSDEARAGQRTACNLSIPRESIARGETLVKAGTLAASRLLDVRVRWLSTTRDPLRRRARVLLHAGCAQTLATVSLLDRGEVPPGESALAQLHADEPLVLLPGDRFILRGFGLQKEHRTTVGGGVVLRVLGPRHRRGSPSVIAELVEAERAAEAEDVAARTALEVRWAGPAGLARADLGARLPYPPRLVEAAINKLLQARTVIRFDRDRGSLVHKVILDDLRRRALGVVDAHHAGAPLLPGLPREALRSQLPAAVPPRLFHLLLESLAAEGALAADRDLARRPGHKAGETARGKDLAPDVERVHALFLAAGLSPPRPPEAAQALDLAEKTVKESIDLLVRGGRMVRVADLFFDRDTLDALKGRLMAFLRERGQITAQEWKELVGTTRKFAIPLAEHFDAERITLRVGEIRRLRRI